MTRAVITGSGSEIPPTRVTNAMLARIMDTSDEWIRERSGVEARHYVEAGTATSDLGAYAARQALEDASVAAADVDLVVFAIVTPATARAPSVPTPMMQVLRVRAIAICGLMVIAGAASAAMLEPVIPLLLESRAGLGPAAIGTLFGVSALAASAMHPLYGRLSDRWGGGRLMIAGLSGFALILPAMSFVTDFKGAAITMIPMWMVLGLFITPSLTYFAQLASQAGVRAFGVVYGVYNVAWAAGLMAGPVLGGFLLQHAGFTALTIGWSGGLMAASVSWGIWQVKTRK